MAFRVRQLALALALALPMSFLVGCGSSDSSSTAATPPALSGTYTLDSEDPTADFDEITFIDDTRYMIDPTGCDDGDLCKKQGWYTVDGDQVALHDDGTDDVKTYTIDIAATEPTLSADSTGDGAGETPEDGGVPTETDGTDDGGEAPSDGGSLSLTHEENREVHVDSLVNNGSSLTGGTTASRVLVNGRSMSRSKSLVSSSGQLVGTNLAFEGTCAFLRGCSVPSQGSAAGTVKWGCGGTACSDSEHWMAVPKSRRSLCGQTVNLCHGSKCTTALVRDISNAGIYEGSSGLLDALGLTHGGQCVNGRVSGGYGGGMVTLKF